MTQVDGPVEALRCSRLQWNTEYFVFQALTSVELVASYPFKLERHGSESRFCRDLCRGIGKRANPLMQPRHRRLCNFPCQLFVWSVTQVNTLLLFIFSLFLTLLLTVFAISTSLQLFVFGTSFKMRYSILYAASSLLALAVAQNRPNPFTLDSDFMITAGEPTTITWEPTTDGTVSIRLRSGASSDLEEGTEILCKCTLLGRVRASALLVLAVD